jgi:hypothetical protein
MIRVDAAISLAITPNEESELRRPSAFHTWSAVCPAVPSHAAKLSHRRSEAQGEERRATRSSALARRTRLFVPGTFTKRELFQITFHTLSLLRSLCEIAATRARSLLEFHGPTRVSVR